MTEAKKNNLTVMPARSSGTVPPVPSIAAFVIRDEFMEDLLAIEKLWFTGYGVNPDGPENQYEADLIRIAARADWFFQRADRNYAEIESRTYSAVSDPMLWDANHHKTLTRFLRYRRAHADAVSHHREVLERYRRDRAAEFRQIQEIQLAADRLAIEFDDLAE